jgi:hypothetical protein
MGPDPETLKRLLQEAQQLWLVIKDILAARLTHHKQKALLQTAEGLVCLASPTGFEPVSPP